MFDEITGTLGLQRLKTMGSSLAFFFLIQLGNSYVVVANALNECCSDHAVRAVNLASIVHLFFVLPLRNKMQESLKNFNSKKNPVGMPVEIRIGIHSDTIVSSQI